MIDRLLSISALLGTCLLCPAGAALVTFNLTGTNGTGALNIVNFDSEATEPSDPGASHGYAYFFNEDTSLWSILPSSPTVASAAYYANVLNATGIQFSSLTVSTVTPHPNPGLFHIGSFTYDDTLVSPTGTTVLAPGQFGLSLTTSDYVFSPYYGSLFSGFSLTASAITGTGLTFTNGILTSANFTANTTLSKTIFLTTYNWNGTLNFSGLNFTFLTNDVEVLPGLGDLTIYLDRAGTITVIPEPSTWMLALLGTAVLGLALRRRASLSQRTTQTTNLP